jgi:hypothetical protein
VTSLSDETAGFGRLKSNANRPDLNGPGGSSLLAGARSVADSDRLPIVTAHRLCAEGKRETRKMVRLGPAA